MTLEQFIPKGNFKSAILTSFERITQPVTDFIRGNPLVSTAAIGIGTTGLITAVAAVRRKRKKKVSRRKVSRKKTTRRKKTRRVTHRKPRHKGHKRVSFTTASGKRVKFLVRGQKRSPKHRRKSGHKSRRFIKGTPEAKRFMAKLRRMKR